MEALRCYLKGGVKRKTSLAWCQWCWRSTQTETGALPLCRPAQDMCQRLEWLCPGTTAQGGLVWLDFIVALGLSEIKFEIPHYSCP